MIDSQELVQIAIKVLLSKMENALSLKMILLLLTPTVLLLKTMSARLALKTFTLESIESVQLLTLFVKHITHKMEHALTVIQVLRS